MEKTIVQSTSEVVECTLAEPELRRRGSDLRAGFFAAITAARETDDGFELAFPSASADMVRDFVAVESQCCRFLTFTIEDRDGHTWLTLSGPEGTKAFVRDHLALYRRWVTIAHRNADGGVSCGAC